MTYDVPERPLQPPIERPERVVDEGAAYHDKADDEVRPTDSGIFAAAQVSQDIARKQGEVIMGVRVHRWAVKYSREIKGDALLELIVIIKGGE